MKKITTVLLLLVMLMGLTACNDAGDADTVDIGAASVADNGPSGLKMVLDDIGMLQLGTMGVSLNATSKAVDLLEWCAATAMTADQIADEVKVYLECLAEDTKVIYPEQLLTVTTCCENLKDEEYRSYMLMDIGYDPEGYDWDESTFEKAAAIARVAQAFIAPVG